MSAVTIQQLQQTLKETHRTGDRQRLFRELWRMIHGAPRNKVVEAVAKK